jgi:Flp pilus assembly protein TadD
MAPGDPRTDLLWADMREQEGDIPAALEAVGRARRKAPEDLAVHLRYARLLSESGEHGEAETVLRALGPKLPTQRLYMELGVLRTREGRDREARDFFAKAVGEGPQSRQAHFHLGMAHYRLGDLDAAEEELRAADRMDVSDPRALAALCAMQVKAGLLEAARVTKMDMERRFQGQAELIRNACRGDR